MTARFCFFIDGLDEYDGDPDNIVDVLESLRSWPEIKLCISSRPWNEFIDAFGRPWDPQLALEDLTRKDVKLFVRDTLEENSRFRELKARHDCSQDLVQEIVEKARGVFLWVFLVVRSLLTGLKNADRMCDLQRRLRHFPQMLGDFFRQMLAPVEAIYQEQTAQAFTFALEAMEPLSLITYSFLDEDYPDLAITAPAKPLTKEDILLRREDMRRRLNGRCKGLLEVVNSGNATGGLLTEGFMTPKVDFLHRTARDFLFTKDMQSMLAKNLKPEFEPKLRLCKAFLSQMKALDYTALNACNGLLEDLLEDLTYYAHRLELETGIPQVDLLDEVGKSCLKLQYHWSREGNNLNFLGFLVQRELFLYVAEKVRRDRQLLRSGGEPLLYSALHPRETKYSTKKSFHSKTIDMLLNYGASPNQIYKDSTVWGHFILSLESRTQGNEAFLPIIKTLLLHGADPHKRVLSGYNTRPTKGEGFLAAGSNSYLEPIYKSARTIIKERFRDDQVGYMLRKAPAQPRSRLNGLLARLEWCV